MKRIVKILFISLFVFFNFITFVYAEDASDILDKSSKTQESNKKLTYADLENATLAGNDYEISCVYENGTNLIISRRDATIANSSISNSRNSNSNFDFYVTPDQSNEMKNETTVVYNHDKILSNGHCPGILYGYAVNLKVDTTDSFALQYFYSLINLYFA